MTREDEMIDIDWDNLPIVGSDTPVGGTGEIDWDNLPVVDGAPAQSAANPPRMTREERIAQNQRAIETARSQEEPGFFSAAGDAIAEGAKGAARAVKSIGSGIVGMASGAVRLAGTPVRAVTGWEGLHRLADTIDSSYENFGRDALISEYGENPDGWGYAAGRFGEKLAGTAGSLAAIGGPGLIAKAGKLPGAVRATGAAVQKALPLMFGNDAAVRAYDTARANRKSKSEAAALAGLNGAIHFLGFKAFENKALNKMLGMPAEMEAMMPKWAGEAAEAGGQSFSSLARGVRNGMIKYTLAERGKGALRAGGIMGLQNFLSDPVMQVAEGASIDDIDFSRMLKAGAEGVGEGALMEGALGAAAVLKSPAEARKFIADKIFRGKDYKVIGADGKPHDEPGLLNSSEGRMMLMKQNPGATERVLDIVEHGGTPRPAELDAAFLPPDMKAEELKKFAADWRKDIEPYVEEAWAADAPRRDIAPDASATGPSRDILTEEEAARAQQQTEPEITQEQANETRTDEAPAQPEQGEVVAPAAGAEARPVEGAETRAEAADARVVERPAVWPNGWDNAGEEIKGYVVPNDGDVAPGREVAIAHRSGGSINAPQKIKGVVESVDGDKVKVYYRDGMGYDQHDTFKKSELVGVMPLTAVPTEGATPQTAQNRIEATQEGAGAQGGAAAGEGTPVPAKPTEGASRTSGAVVEIDATTRESAKKVRLSAEAIADIKDWIAKNPNGNFTHNGFQKIFDAEMERVKAANGGVNPEVVLPTLDAISVAYHDMKSAKPVEAASRVSGAKPVPDSKPSSDRDYLSEIADNLNYDEVIDTDTYSNSDIRAEYKARISELTDEQARELADAWRKERAADKKLEELLKGDDDNAIEIADREWDAADSKVQDIEHRFKISESDLIDRIEAKKTPPPKPIPDGKGKMVKPADAAKPVSETPKTEAPVTAPTQSGNAAPGISADDFVAAHSTTDAKGRRVANNDIGSQGEIAPPPGYAAKKTKPVKPGDATAALKAVGRNASQDDTRIVIKRVHIEGGQMVATDGRRLVVAPAPDGVADGDYDAKGSPIKPTESYVPYPANWRQVVPDVRLHGYRKIGEIANYDAAHGRIAFADETADKVRRAKGGNLAVSLRVGNAGANPQFVKEVVNTMFALGAERLEVFQAPDYAPVVFKGRNARGEITGVVMPLRVDGKVNAIFEKGTHVKLFVDGAKSADFATAPAPATQTQTNIPNEKKSPAQESASPSATWTDRGGTTHKLDGFDPPSADNITKGRTVAIRHDNGVLYSGELVGVGPKNVKIKTQSDMYGEQVLTFPKADVVGVKSNRLRRADGTDPLAEKNPAPKTVRKAVDKISLAISNRTGTGVITPEEADGIVRGIVESPETKHNRYRDFFNPLESDAKWHESLGLDAESAKNIRDAVDRVKTDADLKKWFPQVDAAVKKANDGRLSKKDAAPLFGKISEGLEKAERMGLSETANRLREAAEVIRPVAETVEQGDVNKFNYSTKGKKLNNRLGGTDKRGGKTVSLDTKDGTVDVRADGKGSTLDGNRHLIIDGVNGDELTVTMKDAAGKTLATRKMNRAQWSALAKGAVATDGDPAAPQKGDLIRMFRNGESPAERDLRFATDENYQKWLKSRKANDAEPLRERYEQEQAKAAKSIARNTLPGVDVEVVDRAFNPETDGGVGKRKSIGGIFTGTAADYANRSRQGGKGDGPSLQKIGTGEGSQVYGWGLYGSTVRGVAEGYAKADLSRKDAQSVLINGKDAKFASAVEMRVARAFERAYGNVKGTLENLRNGYYDAEIKSERGHDPNKKAEAAKDAEFWKQAIEDFEANPEKYRLKEGNLYEQTFFTDRAPGDESHLLKWYEPVSKENLNRMAEYARKMESDGERKFEIFDPDDVIETIETARREGWTAQKLYDSLTSDFNQIPRYASNFLARAGIDGIKYPVDSYGGKGVKDGDKVGWNYVAFSDEHIRVDHKWADGQMRYMRNGDGEVVGTFDRSTNKIKLYRGATAATLVHELGGHATLRFAEQEAERGNRQLLDRINRTIDEAPQALKDEIRSRYPGVDETALRDEIWAALRERNSPAMEKAIKTLQGKAWYNRAWSAFRDAWKGLLARMGFNRADLSQIDRMSNDEFLSHLDRIMSDGKTLGRLEAMGEGTRNAMSEFSPSAESQGSAKVTPAEDAAYMDAVRRGDMETAQRMVDEAAERSGYGRIGFHGTKYKHGRFTEFAKGSHVGSEIYQALSRIGVDVDSPMSKDKIKRIVEDLKANGKDILSLRVALKNPLRISDFGESWHGLEFVRKLYAEHPDLFSPVEWDRLAKNPTLAHEMIEAKGYDGLVYDNTSEGILDYSGDTPGRYDAKGEYIPNDAYIPFHASQIKSADAVTRDDAGNVIPLSQRFNPQSDDIREARSPRPAGSRIMDDQQTKGEKFTEKFIDSLAPAKSVQDEIGGVKEVTRADGYTDHTKSTDLVAAKDKANGRLEHEVRQHQFRIDGINRDLARAALPKKSTEDLVDDFNLYLQCKHAPERNLSVAQDRGDVYTPNYSEGMGQITLPGGNRIGLSENVANRLLKGLRGKYGLKIKMFENAADKVYKMLEADLDRRFDAGRLSAEDYAFYKTRWHGPGGADGKWAHYVPLKTDIERLEPEALNSSTAGMKRNEFMKAQGRGSGDIADSPLAAAVLQTEQGIRGSIRNEVANVEANLVEHAQEQGKPIAEIVPGDEIRRGRTYSFTFADGETVDASGSMRLVENHPEIHLFKRDGKLYAIRYQKGENGRGLAFARAASGENMGRWGQGLEWIPHMTHWMSAMRTQYSPEFTVSNWLADHLEAAQALIGRYGLKEGGKAFVKTVASEIQNWKDLRAYLKDGTANGYIKEFVEGGGLTKGGVASEGFEAETQKIRSKIEQFRREQKQWREMSPADLAKSLGRNVTDFLSFANELAEYSTRTGLYTALRKQGVPQAEAIKFARDATVNFNRKGTAMPYINGLYMFANASVQGAVRSVQAMRDTHGKELVAALTAIGVAKAVIDNFLGNDDEREAAGGRNARNQSEYDKKHNVGVPIGGGRQIVPLRFRGPYAAIPYLAQTAANVAMGATSPEDGAKTLFRELGDQVTDLVGGNGIMNDRGELDGALIGQSIAPSVADPIVQLATGKDYKGDERRRKSFDKTMPASSNGKRSTASGYKMFAKGVNYLTGGNELRKGLADFAPEDYQLVLEFLGGAPMRDINNVASSVNNAMQLASGGTPERTLSQIPFVRRIVREYPESTSRYYDALEEYERDKAEFKKTTPERRKEMKADKPYLFVGKSLLDGQIEQVKKYMHLERGEVKVGQKWVEPKTPRTEAQKEEWRKKRLALQAQILKRLGK